MKQLTISLLFLSLQLHAQSPRFLYVKDNVALDTKEAMVAPAERFDFLFDKYGKYQVPETEIPNLLLAKSDSLKRLYVIIPYAELEVLTFAKFINWAGHFKELLPSFIPGGLTDYGKVRSLKYHEPGNYTINAWQPEYVYYSAPWRIPTDENAEGCKCSFQEAPKIGDYVEIPFNGTGIEIIGEKVYSHGIVSIHLDGQIVKNNVDQYAPKGESVAPPNGYFTIYKVNGLPSQQHVIRITVIGKNPAATNYYFVLHRFQVTNIPSIPDQVVARDTIPVYDTVRVEIPISEIHDIVISQHTDIKEAYEKATDLKLTRKGYYQLMQKPDSSLYIKQPDIEIEKLNDF